VGASITDGEGNSVTELLVPRRFRGPSSSGNGGWTAGALAGLVDHDCPDNRADAWPAIRVALRRPPPLDTPMAVAVVDGSTEASIDGEVVARATLSDTDPVSSSRCRPPRRARPWRRTPA
jgi:hypothetical protein